MMTKKLMIFAMLFGIAFMSITVSAQVNQVRVATNSSSYSVWEPQGPFNLLDHYRSADIEIMVLYPNGTGVSGQTVTLSYSPDLTANTGGSNVPTTATEIGAGRYTANFKITEDSSSSSLYSGVVITPGNYTITATTGGKSGSYTFRTYYMLCNNCHWDDADSDGVFDSGEEMNLTSHQSNPGCADTCHGRHGDVSEAAWIHSSIISGGGRNQPEMNWGTTDAPDACTDCHDNTVLGKHSTAQIDGTPVGCGVGPGADGSVTCHGAQDLAKDPPYVDYPADCHRCHKNLSRGEITSEGAALNINKWADGVDHEDSNGAKVVPCATCKGGAHNISLPKPGTSDINAQCKVCHTTQSTQDYRGSDCKGCHYNDTNNNGFLDSSDYINVHIRGLNPNYVWDSSDGSPEDNSDDPTDATYSSAPITSDASGFRASQNVNVKLLDGADTQLTSWAVTTGGTGAWSGLTSYTFTGSETSGIWKYYVSTDGGSTYTLYDRFTVSAAPEFPMGAGFALGASMLLYVWRRRKYKA